MNKKGNVENIPAYVISFILIGLIVAISLVVLSKFQTAMLQDTTITNENITGNGTLANIPVISITSVTNNTGSTVSNTLYSLTGNNIGIKTTATGTWFLVTYEYDAVTKASTSLGDTVDAVAPVTTDWLPIIVIVAIVGVLLSLILGAFTFYKGRR